MQNPFETMALNFTNAIKYLEQPLENLQKSSYREFHLQNIKLVLSKSMPLKEPVLRKIILLIIHNFTSKKLLETEIILLLENLEFLFRNYDFQIYSKIFFEEKEICALIITQLLACLQHLNKDISHKSIIITNKMLEFTFVKDLKNFLPKICSEYFKALNREYNVMNKTLVLIVQGLENIMIKTLEIQKVNEKIDLNIKYKNLLSFKDSRNQIQEKDETILRITSFLEIFYKNLERNNYNLKIAKAFMHFILETIDIFLQSSALKWLILIYIYFNNVSFENNNNEIDSLYKKLVTKEEYQIITVITFLKEELLLYIKHIERLPLDLDSKIFLKTFRVLKDIFYLTDLHFYKGTTNLKELKAFHFEEAETIAKTFLKTFCIKSLKNTKIEINEQMLEINLFSTKVLEKESIYINEEKTFNFQTRKIIDNFELMNFDENVFFSINEMFLKIESSLAFYLFEFYFHKLAEFRYSFEDQPPIKEIISLLFLSNQMISRMINYSFYCKNWLNFLLSNPKICKVYDEYLIKYIELLLGFDYLPSEDLRYHIADYKVIFEMLKIQGINLSFLLINHDYQSNFLNKFNIIYYLLEKYVENDSFLKTLIEKHLAYFIFCLEKEKNVSDFLDKYMSNLINRIILQIRSIQILENKLQPFKVFHAILMLIENDEKGIVMFHMFCMDVWTTLSKCFDKYYILSDKKFIHLMLVIIKQIMRIIAKKHQIVTLNDDENLKFNEVNLIRQILLRIKPLITNKNNEIMVLSNEIFKESLIIIHKKKMIVEENPTNFSTEDSINVSIPDALGPIAYEFFPNYIFLLKNLKNLLGIFQCVDVFRRISDLNKEFFKNGHRFCKEIWPELKIILEKIGVNDLNHNLKKKVCIAIFDFIKEIGFFQDEEFCKSSCCGQKKSEICKAFDLLKNKLELQEIS